MRKRKNVVVFMPVAKTSLDTDFFITYLRTRAHLQSYMDKLPWDVNILEWPDRNFPIDANRNVCAQLLMDGFPIKGGLTFQADISIWLDTDHTIPDHTLYQLLQHDKPIMLGVYYVKVPDREHPFYPVLFKKREDNDDLFRAVMEYPEKEIFEVDFAGMGCACIHKEVFEKLERPYFKYMTHPLGTMDPMSEMKHKNDIQDISEDRWFWDQVRTKTSYPILVDPSIQLGHIGRMVFDQHMYRAYLKEFKDRRRKIEGDEKFEETWTKMAVALPYKELVAVAK